MPTSILYRPLPNTTGTRLAHHHRASPPLRSTAFSPPTPRSGGPAAFRGSLPRPPAFANHRGRLAHHHLFVLPRCHPPRPPPCWDRCLFRFRAAPSRRCPGVRPLVVKPSRPVGHLLVLRHPLFLYPILPRRRCQSAMQAAPARPAPLPRCPQHLLQELVPRRSLPPLLIPLNSCSGSSAWGSTPPRLRRPSRPRSSMTRPIAPFQSLRRTCSSAPWPPMTATLGWLAAAGISAASGAENEQRWSARRGEVNGDWPRAKSAVRRCGRPPSVPLPMSSS